jgi:hypothetical protein
MGRIFWKGFSESRSPDGRRLLNVEFTEKETEEVYRWTPRWAQLLVTIQRASEVEAANQAGGRFENVLREARAIAEKAGRPATFAPEELGRSFEGVCRTMLELGKEHFSPDYSLGPTELKLAAEMVAVQHILASPRDEPPRWCYCPWDCDGWHRIGECCPRCRSDPYYRR